MSRSTWNFKGSVTLFFCLIFSVILGLICSVLESARMYAAGVRAESMTYMTLESEFAGYAKQVFKDYGVLLLWNENGVERNVENNIRINNGEADSRRIVRPLDILQLSLKSVEVKNITYATDDGGDELVRQILQYEKYAVAGELTEQLLELLQHYKNGKDKREEKEDTLLEDVNAIENMDSISEEDLGILQQIESEYTQEITELQKMESGYDDFKKQVDKIYGKTDSDEYDEKEKHTEKELKKLKKAFNSFSKKLVKQEKQIERALTKTKEYKDEKDNILVKYNLKDYVNEVPDYFENERNSLINAKDIQQNLVKNYFDDGITKIEKALKDEKYPTKGGMQKEYIELIYEEFEKYDAIIGKLNSKADSQVDEKDVSIYEQAKQLIKTGVLELVLPEDVEVSSREITQDGLPSNNIKDSKEEVLGSIGNKALFTQYIATHFSTYANNISDKGLIYEMEYVLNGNSNDKDNLLSTVKELVAVRQLFNTLYMIGDAEKRSVCTQTAASVSVTLGVPFLEPLIDAILVQAWTLAESIRDVQDLLAGNGVPMIKTSDSWNTDFGNFVTSKREVQTEKSDKSSGTEEIGLGLTYETYLQLLLLLKENEVIAYRTMDLIQININKKYNSDFAMAECITSANINATYVVPELFVRLPFVKPLINDKTIGGEYHINAQYGYIY